VAVDRALGHEEPHPDLFLSPPLANHLMPYNTAVGAIGEISLTLWLLVVGVNVQGWKRQAADGSKPMAKVSA
jgi:hypothetical protein